jgi:hypothetical protein
MKKQISLKVASITILSVLILAIGATCFASTMWTHLNSCSYVFFKSNTYTDYDTIDYGGSTTTGTGKYAYVYVEMQQLKNGSWKYFASMNDLDYMIAGCEDDIAVDPGYTYRLKIVHKALDEDNHVLETHTHYSNDYVVSWPRTGSSK